MARVRYFAGAAEAAGTEEETIDGASVDAVLDAAETAHPRLAEVLPRCSVLVDGQFATDRDAPLAVSAVVDVLPPFAGG